MSVTRRGESIVEVVVSCGVLMIVFSSVLTLVMQSVGLNLSARSRTEAVSEAQLRLNRYIVDGRDAAADALLGDPTLQDSGSCLARLSSDPTTMSTIGGPDDGDCLANKGSVTALISYLATTGKTSCSYVTVKKLSAVEQTGGVDMNVFQKAEAHVFWVSRGIGVEEYILARLVRK